MSHFTERLNSISRTNRSLLCVGLDPDPERMPISDVFEFNKGIIDATKDLVCAYKPNLAFYEAMGLYGLKALQKTVAHIRNVSPDVVILLSAMETSPRKGTTSWEIEVTVPCSQP